AGAGGEVDVLRELAVRADRVARVLAGRGRARDRAADQDVAQVDRLHVIAGKVDVEVEDGDGEVGPDDDVGQDGRGRRVVDREQGGDPVRVVEVDLEVRQQQGRTRHVVDRAKDRPNRTCGHERTAYREREKNPAHERTPPWLSIRGPVVGISHSIWRI